MEDSVFTKIINGELPCHKIYEDERTIAFLTIGPVREGHTLVVPKIQVDQYLDLPDEYYDALWKAVKKVGSHLRTATGKARVGVVIKGIDVPHTHVHLIPFNEDENLEADSKPAIADSEALAEVAKRLALV